MNMIEKSKCLLQSVQNIAGKGVNAGFQDFFHNPMFSKGFFQGLLSQNCVVYGYKGI